jgi:hypothetical protein
MFFAKRFQRPPRVLNNLAYTHMEALTSYVGTSSSIQVQSQRSPLLPCDFALMAGEDLSMHYSTRAVFTASTA